MSVVQHQWSFLRSLSDLIAYAETFDGVMLTGGDLWQDNEWHKANSFGDCTSPVRRYKAPHLKCGQHPKRLAVDLNLFVQGVYQTRWHPMWDKLGAYWKSLSRHNRWGGDFKKRDYNHFERKP